MYANHDKCEEFNLDPEEVERIAKRIARAAEDARKLGLTVFGGSGHGSLRKTGGGFQNEVAYLGINFDGGDGADVY